MNISNIEVGSKIGLGAYAPGTWEVVQITKGYYYLRHSGQRRTICLSAATLAEKIIYIAPPTPAYRHELTEQQISIFDRATNPNPRAAKRPEVGDAIILITDGGYRGVPEIKPGFKMNVLKVVNCGGGTYDVYAWSNKIYVSCDQVRQLMETEGLYFCSGEYRIKGETEDTQTRKER